MLVRPTMLLKTSTSPHAGEVKELLSKQQEMLAAQRAAAGL